MQTERPRGRRWAILWAAASAASIALLSILTMVAWPRPAVQASLEPPMPIPAFVPAPVLAPTADAVPAVVQTRPVTKAPVAKAPVAKAPVTKARTTVKRAGTPVHKPASKPSFFKRQLLRIVIK